MTYVARAVCRKHERGLPRGNLHGQMLHFSLWCSPLVKVTQCGLGICDIALLTLIILVLLEPLFATKTTRNGQYN